MKYYIIAGEASGDLHGSNLVKSLAKKDPRARFRGWGGDLMQQSGVELVRHYKDLAFMGFWEVAMNLRTILRNLEFCKKDIEEWRPDAVILVDYPGFNLRIAQWAKSLDFKVYYYISPQLWAWKPGRVKIVKEAVDRMYAILPFEKEFYSKYEVEVDFVGHPLLDVVKDFKAGENFRHQWGLSEKPIIALLPGSRKQEISTMLPTMLKMIPEFPDYQFVIAAAPSQPKGFYNDILQKNNSSAAIVENQTYALLSETHAALVTSGTATLETALFGVPEVVCYKGSFLSYQIARHLVKVPYISLVNLVSNKMVVPELIQNNFNANSLQKNLLDILDGKKRDKMLQDYSELRHLLGESGAAEKTAELIYKNLTNP